MLYILNILKLLFGTVIFRYIIRLITIVAILFMILFLFNFIIYNNIRPRIPQNKEIIFYEIPTKLQIRAKYNNILKPYSVNIHYFKNNPLRYYSAQISENDPFWKKCTTNISENKIIFTVNGKDYGFFNTQNATFVKKIQLNTFQTYEKVINLKILPITNLNNRTDSFPTNQNE